MADTETGAAQAADEMIQYRVEDRIATITLNHPDKLNAFNDTMVIQLAQTLRRFDIDENAYVAVITGNGRAFSSGADVRQRQMRSREEFEKLGGSAAGWGANGHELLTKAVNWKPVIAAPHGYAIGMAWGLCLTCEFIVADEETKFQVTETRRGLSGARYYALMNFRGGGSFATEAAMTGRFFSAQEAHAAGIVDRVAPAGKAHEAAVELAREIDRNPPLGVRSTVRTRRWFMEKMDLEDRKSVV